MYLQHTVWSFAKKLGQEEENYPYFSKEAIVFTKQFNSPRGLYFDLPKYYNVPHRSKAQPCTVSQNSFQQQYSQCYISVPSTHPSWGPYTIPSRVPWFRHGSREEENTVLKKDPEAATYQFFGLLQETLYQNTAIVDILRYKCWCLLCICGGGGCQVFPSNHRLQAKYSEHLSAVWMLTSNNHPAVFYNQSKLKFSRTESFMSKEEEASSQKGETLTIKYTTWAYSAKCCFSTGSTHSLSH